MLLAEVTPEKSSFYSRIILDYLNGHADLKSFYAHPHSFQSFEQLIAKRNFPDQNREKLVGELRAQYAKINLKKGSKVNLNIESLLQPDTYTVTTGHQLCVMTGPLYFLFKIVHTIKLADELKTKYPKKNFVPVFWMASEDHDFDEVKSFMVGGNRFTWEHENTHQPVGRYDLQGIQNVFKELKNHYRENTIPEFFTLAEKIYTSSESLSEATFRLVNELFEAYGLVILDPDCRSLKELFSDVMRKDILQNESYRLLSETNQRLKKLKYPQQVNGREINFFYLIADGRKLITRNGNTFVVGEGGLVFSEEEMKQEIALYPERFSPNVVLRPVYQEVVLPNLAYVGGPGEIAYWLQLKDVFETHQTSFPLLALRNSFALLSSGLNHKRTKLNLPDELYFSRPDTIHAEALMKIRPTDEDATADKIDELLQKLINEAEPISNKMSSDLIKLKQENREFFEVFRKRLRKAKADLDQKQLNDVMLIRDGLFPGNTPAERVNNILEYVKLNDHHTFIKAIYEQSDAITKNVKLIQY